MMPSCPQSPALFVTGVPRGSPRHSVLEGLWTIVCKAPFEVQFLMWECPSSAVAHSSPTLVRLIRKPESLTCPVLAGISNCPKFGVWHLVTWHVPVHSWTQSASCRHLDFIQESFKHCSYAEVTSHGSCHLCLQAFGSKTSGVHFSRVQA